VNYYNEWDKYAAQWLRNLIDAGHLPEGEVDERSIADVSPDDLIGFTQCHFFAGIGGWSLALDLAGWPRHREVWTGSCPCQPFSSAGQGGTFSDHRHLWPEFNRLIESRRPRVVFGEQVASKDGLAWLDLVQADLEIADYTSAAIDLCAAGIGAPHIRQRLYWVADTYVPDENQWAPSREQSVRDQGGADHQGMEHAASYGRKEWRPESGWRGAELRRGTDGIARPIESGIEPLANGIPARMDKLRGYGNAIIPSLASEVIGAYLECRP
jgi:DNA (cytosine-5)-methyltransferase 1